MAEYAERQVDYYDLPLPKGVKLLHPEKVVFILNGGGSIDIGSLCYLCRSKEPRRAGKGRKVDSASLSQSRKKEIRSLIDHIVEKVSSSGLRPKTFSSYFYRFYSFIDWCDSNKHINVLNNKIAAGDAFRAYVEHLRRLVGQNIMANSTAVRYQDAVKIILQDFLNIEDIGQGINLLIHDSRLTDHTAVPDESSQREVLAWSKCLFIGLSELVVDKKHYPYSLAVPTYLNWPDDRLWVFPVKRQWCQPPGHAAKNQCRAFNYEDGTVRTYEEMNTLFGKPEFPSRYVDDISRSLSYIERSNQDYYCHDRLDRGILAVKSFLIMFIAATGMNPTQAIETPWSEELEESVQSPLVERQGFRSIKYRANNRNVHFEIGVEYMPYLRRYIQLRNYLLHGKQFEDLFFGFGKDFRGSSPPPKRFSADVASRVLYTTLHRLTPSIPKVVPKQWRAAKQDNVISNHDPATAALIMQHSIETAVKKYSNGSEGNQRKELSAFLSQVEKVVLKNGQEIVSSEACSVGICISPKDPQPIASHLPITPDCKGAEGCLFCDKYRVHADEKDTRKLFSARFCINKTSFLASSREQFGKLFGGVLQRIDFILNEIRRRDPRMVERVEIEVDDDGELDPFWSIKLGALMELGLV